MKSSLQFLSALVCTFVAVAACSSDDDPDTVVEPEPTTLAIAELRPSGGDAWRAGDPEPVVLGCDRLLSIALELENWTLRPRGACGSVEQCGYVNARLTAPGGDSISADAALQSVVLDLGSVELTPDEAVKIRVELRTGDGDAFEQPRGEILFTELEVLLQSADDTTCEPGSGGAGGQSGSAGAGGAGEVGGGAAGTAGDTPAPAGGGGGAGEPGSGGAGGEASSSGGAGGDSTASGGAAGEAGAPGAGAGGEAGGG